MTYFTYFTKVTCVAKPSGIPLGKKKIFWGENDMAAGFPTVVCCESISIKQTNITVVLNLQFAFFAARQQLFRCLSRLVFREAVHI